MKKCPKCSTIYHDIWNVCTGCSQRLRSPNIMARLSSLFTNAANVSIDLLENIVEQADTLFIYLDRELRPVMCNNKIQGITGYSRQDIFRGDWLDLLFQGYPARKEIFKAVLGTCLNSNTARVYEGAITKKDGSECILSWRNTAITDETGDIAGIVCTAQDITEKKDSESDVAVQSDRLRNILASIKDYALVSTNLEGKITYYGAGASELFGWSEDMIFQDITSLFPEETRSQITKRMEEAIAKHGKFEEEVQLVRKPNIRFSAILTMSVLLGNKNDRIGYIYIARDITEKQELEKQLVQSEKLAAIGQLAAGVAHEINNPLLVIMGRIDMMLMDDNALPADIKTTIETIRGQAQRMRTITDRLLHFARKGKMNAEDVDVNKILKSISPLLAYHPEFKRITWKEELQTDLPVIQGDFNQLQEVLINFGLNACQAMPNGGEITISSKDTRDGLVEIAIKDTGVGIREQDIKKLFTPFFTTKDKGTGLGLAICQSIISSHGGDVKVESQQGVGTTFKIRLPIKKGV